MNTIPFGPRNPPEDELLAKAAELPKEVEPGRDRWPGIAARLGEAPRAERDRGFRWPMALAAGFAVAAVSALLTWGVVREQGATGGTVVAGTQTQTQPPLVNAPAPTDIVPVSYGPNSGVSAVELAARDQLVARFRESFTTLRPETRVAIVKNLAIMQTAANEIDAALAKDPASGMLKSMLVGTYKQELQLYSTVVTSGDGLTRRI
jgi:hypothetical protein